MKTEVDGYWYQSIHFDKLSCRQVSFSGPKWTPPREEHKRLSTVHFNANPSVHTRTSYTVSIEHCSINAFPGLTYKHVIVHKLYK